MADRCRGGVKHSEKYFPSKLDQSLFENVNRVKDPAEETSLEKSNAPVITALEKVTAGEPFTVEVSVEKIVYLMGQAHWIEFIELNSGNSIRGISPAMLLIGKPATVPQLSCVRIGLSP